MVKPNQIFEIQICRPSIAEYYKEKGYENAETGKRIEVKAEDLSSGSKFKIQYICDYCGKEFERSIQSNNRSKKNGNEKDACSDCCRCKRSKETSMIKYGVDNPMKVTEIQQKCEQSRINNPNFQNSNFISSSGFVNGIPVSQAQYNLSEILNDFILNYHYDKYYIDLIHDNIAIEYNGKGHDLEVKLNKCSEEEFKAHEQIKLQKVLEQFRLLIIIDKKDRFKNKNNIKPYLSQIKKFIEGTSDFQEIIIS